MPTTGSPAPQIDRFQPQDQRAVEALYRRVFGHDAAEASRLRWDWQYRLNPNNPGHEPQIWMAREGGTIIGQYATMPVWLCVKGRQIDASWGMDVMVAPERQRRGIGEVLFRQWDRHVGASLGLGPSESSHRLFRKLNWPDVGPVPCLAKPLTRRALRRPGWPLAMNRVVSALTLPFVRIIARDRPMPDTVRPVGRFDESFTGLWDRLAPRFDFAVRRDAPYLNWRYASPPHVRYAIVALVRNGRNDGYAVYRHATEPLGRVTLLVDFLVDPDDEPGMSTLLSWVDQEARAADSDKIRCYAMHAGFRRMLRRGGYFQVKSTMEFVARINSVEVGEDFYRNTDAWHVTLGDSDQDR